MKKRLLTLLVLFAIATTAGCANALSTSPGYVAKEIEYFAEGSVGVEEFYWISNEKVLFAGKKQSDARGVPYRLLIWNTRSGDVKELMVLGVAARICFDRGYVHVWYNRDGKHYTYAGKLGKPLELLSLVPEALPPSTQFNRHSCRIQRVPSATRPEHGVVAVLRDDHGFVEAERPSESFPQRRYYLVRPSGESVLTALRAAGGGARYSQSSNAYVFQDGGSVTGPNVERRLQVLGIDGRVSVHDLPRGEWMRGTIYGMPVNGATLMVSLSTLARAEGAYLVDGDKVKLIARGYIRNFAVSPDGCKVAMNVTPAERVATRMATVGVCKGGN